MVCLRPYLCVFHLICVLGAWGGGRGGKVPKGLVHNLLMLFFTLGSSKIEVFKPYCFLISCPHKMTIQPMYGMFYTVLHLIWVLGALGGGGGCQGMSTQAAHAVFGLRRLKTWTTQIDHPTYVWYV